MHTFKTSPSNLLYDQRPLSFGRQYFFVPVPGYNTIFPLLPIAPTILVHRTVYESQAAQTDLSPPKVPSHFAII